MMKSIEKINIVILLLATLLLIAAYSVEGKSTIDKKNAGTTSDVDINVPLSNEDDFYGDEEEVVSQELGQPLSTLHPYFDKKNITIYIDKLGQKLTLDCPVKNFDDKQQILWFKEKNNIALGKNSLSDLYEVDAAKFRLIIKNYNDTAIESNFYCEILPQKTRFHILVKVGKAGGNTGGAPEQILASSMPEFSSSSGIRIIESIYLVCSLMTTLGCMKLFRAV